MTTPALHGYVLASGETQLAALRPLPFGALGRYPDMPAGATEVTLQPGLNLLRGRFRLAMGS